MHSRLLFLFGIFLLLTASCEKPAIHINRGFYYWKNTTYKLSEKELDEMQQLHVEKLYVKFFEVEKNDELGLIPSAKTHLFIPNYIWYGNSKDSLATEFINKLDIIPVVFIRNDIFSASSKQELDTLADNINFLVNKYYSEKISRTTKDLHEIQLDCDWTIKTKDNYFYLLRALKKISGKTLSCTLRLYPYKYPDQAGIPPVDRAMLMCYNLVPPFQSENKNSILDNAELENYLDGAKKYPLHLDIALPVFSWMQVYHAHTFAGIINESDINVTRDLRPVKPMWYEVKSDTAVGDLYLQEGDEIKSEAVSKEMIDKTIAQLKAHDLAGDSTTITFFHLDANELQKYSNETLDSFYTAFTRR
jgi:hypothetical protein